jgi:N6-adenosine-specific RNA methylase IME4
MNDFQKNLLKNFPQFTEDDFKYFLFESMRKVHNLGLPVKNCSINNIFIDAKHRKLITAQYCFKNCGFKCLQNKPYKKMPE